MRILPVRSVGVLALLLAPMLQSCGGGDPAGLAPSQAPQPRIASQTSGSAQWRYDVQALLDWAEGMYANFFPSHEPSQQTAPYTYRFYPGSGNYVGAAGSDVYVMGPVSNGELRRVGSIYDFPVRTYGAGLSLVAGTPDPAGSRDGPLAAASFYAPGAMVKDAAGNVFVAEGFTGWFDTHSRIRKISASGEVSTVAGTPLTGRTQQLHLPPGGTGSEAVFGALLGIDIGPDGSVYTVDAWTDVVQRVDVFDGTATTIAGGAYQQGANDGPALSARFQADGVAVDGSGNVFIADTENSTIRKLDTAGNVTTYAGAAGQIGYVDGALLTARFRYPLAMKFDGTGRLFVADRGGIRVIENGTVSTVVTNAQLMREMCTSNGDITGWDVGPDAIDVRADGRLAVTIANCSTAAIYHGSVLETLIGRHDRRGDSDGSAATAEMYFPSGVLFVGNGDLLIADRGTHNIKRYYAQDGTVQIYGGQRSYYAGADGPWSSARLRNPFCLYRSAAGNTFLTQDSGQITKVSSFGSVSTLIHEPSPVQRACLVKEEDDGSLLVAADVLVYDQASASDQELTQFRRYGSTGEFQTVTAAIAEPMVFPFVSAVSATGDVFYSAQGGAVRRYSNGQISLYAVGIGSWPSALAVAPDGSLVTSNNCSIFRISTAGAVTMLSAASCGSMNDGPLATTGFGFVSGLAVGPAGEIYVADQFASVIKKISGGMVSTVAGTAYLNETRLGAPGAIYSPRQIALDPAQGALLVTTGSALLRASLP